MSSPIAPDPNAAVIRTPDPDTAKDEHGASLAAVANQRIEGSKSILPGERESAGLDLSPGLDRVVMEKIEHHGQLTKP